MNVEPDCRVNPQTNKQEMNNNDQKQLRGSGKETKVQKFLPAGSSVSIEDLCRTQVVQNTDKLSVQIPEIGKKIKAAHSLINQTPSIHSSFILASTQSSRRYLHLSVDLCVFIPRSEPQGGHRTSAAAPAGLNYCFPEL